METKRTNKDVLVDGLKKMGIALVLMFAGPTLLHLILTNNDKPFYIPLLIIGILICILAVFFMFKGIQTIMKSLFD